MYNCFGVTFYKYNLIWEYIQNVKHCFVFYFFHGFLQQEFWVIFKKFFDFGFQKKYLMRDPDSNPSVGFITDWCEKMFTHTNMVILEGWWNNNKKGQKWGPFYYFYFVSYGSNNFLEK